MADNKDVQIERLEDEIRDYRRDRGGNNNTLWILLAVAGIGGVGYLIYTKMKEMPQGYNFTVNGQPATAEQKELIQAQIKAGKISVTVVNGRTVLTANTEINLGGGITIPAGQNLKDVTEAAASIWGAVSSLWKGNKEKKTTTPTAPTQIPTQTAKPNPYTPAVTQTSGSTSSSSVYVQEHIALPVGKWSTDHNAVVTIQQYLMALGYLPNAISSYDGIYGDNTEAAVKKFQQEYYIPTGSTGIVDTYTCTALYDAYTKKYGK